MMTELTEKQKKFAEKVEKSIAIIREARSKNSKKKFRNLHNPAKISVTQYGIYNDSYLPTIPAQLERLTRISANVILDMMLEHVGADAKKVIHVYGKPVKLSSASNKMLIKVMRANNAKKMVCSCCGVEAKYAYIESTTLHPDPEKQVYAIAFYGVNHEGVEGRMTVDHIVPRARGGTDDVKNLQIFCQPCNSLKASIPDDVFKKHREVLTELIASENKETV